MSVGYEDRLPSCKSVAPSLTNMVTISKLLHVFLLHYLLLEQYINMIIPYDCFNEKISKYIKSDYKIDWHILSPQ